MVGHTFVMYQKGHQLGIEPKMPLREEKVQFMDILSSLRKNGQSNMTNKRLINSYFYQKIMKNGL